MARIQANRTIALTTPLGDDVLLLRAMTLTEELGRPFRAELDLVSDNAAIDFSKIVGENVTIKMELRDGHVRFFNGYVSQFVQTTQTGRTAGYHATVVPWLWLLTRTADCRIFQNMTVPDIIQQVFKDRGFSDYAVSLRGAYGPWEYCVQYRETDFNFVSRLMEQEGIYYYFEHVDGKHTLMLADDRSSHKPTPDFETMIFKPESGEGGSEREYVTRWTIGQSVQPGTFATTDYDFMVPKKPMQASSTVPRPHGQSTYELFDAPGEYTEQGDGAVYAELRIQEIQAQHEVATATTDVPGVSTGSTFTLSDHPRPDQNREYLITSASYHLTGDDFDAGGGGGGEAYTCTFTAIDAKQPFRPPRTTPKPIVQGPQTAIVTGPAGDEIHTDPHGRVKVQFHWDRHGKRDENSSCWIRVSHGWAGTGWGAVTIPRIGQEVICEFLEGDPDLPIITGRVYNGDNKHPYALPANATQSGVKSRSSKGGSPANFNEIRMEDKKGSEQLYIHAEKNQDIVVEHDKTENVGHDETINIGNDRTETVGHDETITVQNDRTETVVGNETLTVVKDRTRTVNQNETVTVALTRAHTVGINEAITIGAAQEVTIGAMQTITVGANQATSVGANQSNTIGSSQSNTIGGSRDLTVGSDQSTTVGDSRTTSIGKDDTLSVAKKLVVTAGDEISITTGAASIHMKKDGTIVIKGKDITIEGSGAINVKASKDITMKGKKILQN